MRQANGKRTCDFCGKPASGPQALDCSGIPGSPWGPDFQPLRYDLCRECALDAAPVFQTMNSRAFIA